MPAVFVHGSPVTAALWEGLLAELGRDDVVRLSPPGFGTALPGGFDVSPAGYRAWLTAELEHLDGPIDLVGHGWGGVHVVGVAAERPDLVRSWVSDALGTYHPGHVWHEAARTWQVPGRGERHLAGLLGGDRPTVAGRLSALGVPVAVADRVVAGFDPSMAHAILALHRAAAPPRALGAGVRLEDARVRPGLAVIATGDEVVGTEAQRWESAARAGARVAVLEGLGHWWPARYPLRAARVLESFWDSLPAVTAPRAAARAARSR